MMSIDVLWAGLRLLTSLASLQSHVERRPLTSDCPYVLSATATPLAVCEPWQKSWMFFRLLQGAPRPPDRRARSLSADHACLIEPYVAKRLASNRRLSPLAPQLPIIRHGPTPYVIRMSHWQLQPVGL